MMRAALVTMLLGAVSIHPAKAEQTTSRAMSFDACLELIRETATGLGVAPVNIVETSILRMVRFPAADGSILVTCSAPDKKAIIQQTDNVCGVDVNC